MTTTNDHAILSAAMAEFLENRGPTDEAELARLLADRGILLSTATFDAAVRRCGAVRIETKRGPMIALSAQPAEPRRGSVSTSPEVGGLIARTSGAVVLSILAVLVAVTILLLANLNAGQRSSPALRFPDPVSVSTPR